MCGVCEPLEELVIQTDVDWAGRRERHTCSTWLVSDFQDQLIFVAVAEILMKGALEIKRHAAA
jgi:hypothetical protein